MWIARLSAVSALVCVAACGGGGGSGGPPPGVPSGFLYATAVGGPNLRLSDIYGFTVYSNGALSLVPGSPPAAEDGGGGPIAITRDSKFVYSRNLYALTAFQINADGSLTSASGLATPDVPVGVVTHPTADFLYSSSGAGVLWVFTIDPQTGALNQTSSVSLPTQNALEVANSAVITPNGRYLYQNYGQYPAVVQIAGFSIDSATGALSPVPGNPVSPSIPSTTTNSSLAIDPAGKFLYASYQSFVPNGGSDGGVAAYSIDPTSGELIAVPGSPFSVGGVPISAAIDASGKFLIVSTTPRLGGAAGNCLAVLSIDSVTGALTPVSGSPFGPPQYSCGAVIADPSQPFVYVGENANSRAAVSVFSIDQSTGALAAIGQNTVPDSSKLSVGPMARTP